MKPYISNISKGTRISSTSGCCPDASIASCIDGFYWRCGVDGEECGDMVNCRHRQRNTTGDNISKKDKSPEILKLSCYNCNGYMVLRERKLHITLTDMTEKTVYINIYRCGSCGATIIPPKAIDEIESMAKA